jgi:hypothetical protein
MSKLLKAIPIGLAAAALAAPLAQADAFGAPRDAGRPADVGRPNDAYRPGDAYRLRDVKLGRRMNPLKMGGRPNPWRVGVQQRLLPWGSSDRVAY